ncbi:hypothetical protein E2C01_041137 [Portunus trituberculatus]|uniref:Secreted protein n=1 Tax=Portunus trituberculatus TaxID=210409 RepID=A0A5B7FLM4_PORTR|nr:hypothetical protein [Portunus trituberculatus]
MEWAAALTVAVICCLHVSWSSTVTPKEIGQPNHLEGMRAQSELGMGGCRYGGADMHYHSFGVVFLEALSRLGFCCRLALLRYSHQCTSSNEGCR